MDVYIFKIYAYIHIQQIRQILMLSIHKFKMMHIDVVLFFPFLYRIEICKKIKEIWRK